MLIIPLHQCDEIVFRYTFKTHSIRYLIKPEMNIRLSISFFRKFSYPKDAYLILNIGLV